MSSPKSDPTSVRLFYSYSHKDEALREELEKHLSLLKRQDILHDWHDRQINAGREWEGAINENLEAADVLLLAAIGAEHTQESSQNISVRE